MEVIEPRSIVRYARKDMFRLADFVRAKYKESGMNNKDFAAHAAHELNMPGLNVDHIRNLLVDLEIENNQSRRSAASSTEHCTGLVARVSELEDIVARLQKTVAKLMGVS